MSQSILDACAQGTGDDLCAMFHALCDSMIFLVSRLSPTDPQIMRTLQKDSDGWPGYAAQMNARWDRERFSRH